MTPFCYCSGHETAGLHTQAGGQHLPGARVRGLQADREDGESPGPSGIIEAERGEL